MDAAGLAPDKLDRYKRNPWADYLFRPVAITIMIMCLAVSVVNFVRLINPAWNGNYFLLAILITTVEAIYSYRLLQLRPSWQVSRLRYRLAEFVILVVILKLLNFAGMSMAQIGAQLQASWQDPLRLLNAEFAVLLVLAGLAWFAASDTVDDFEQLYDIYADTGLTLQLLRSRFLWGGLILVFITGLSQTILVTGFESLTDFSRPTLSGILVNVLVYFMLGLILISQVNLTRLSVRWNLQDIPPRAGLVKNWARVGLIFMGLITVIAFLLPTNYTMGLLEVAGWLVGALIQLIVTAFYLLFILMNLLAYLLFRLFGGEEGQETGLEPLPPPPVVESPPPAAPPLPWLELLQSLAFWLVAIAVIVFMAKLYLEDHPGLVRQLVSIKPIRLILAALARLWHFLTRWTQLAIEKLPERIKASAPQRTGNVSNGVWNWFNLRGMDSRQRIVAYYLNILQRAEKTGVTRRPHQTPYEYEPDLEQTVPEAQEEVKQLTEVFLRARYSKQTFDPTQTSIVKVYWQRLKRALARKKTNSG